MPSRAFWTACLRTMEQTDPEAFSLYSKALNSMNRDALSAWIACLQPGI